LNCKVLECEKPVRIKKLGYCLKHETRFRRNNNTSIKVRDKTKPVRIPNGPVIYNRKRLEKYRYIISNITPKIQLGYIKNKYELKQEISNLLDDVKRFDGSFGLFTMRYYNYVEATCNSTEVIKLGLFPLDEIPICYAMSKLTPTEKQIPFRELTIKVRNFITKEYLREQLGTKAEKIEVEFDEEGYFLGSKLQSFHLESDKDQEIKLHILINFQLEKMQFR